MKINTNNKSHYGKYLGMHLFCYSMKDVFLIYHSPAGCKKKGEFTISSEDLYFNEDRYFDNYINNADSIFGSEKSLIDAIEKILKIKSFKTIYILTTDVPEIIGFDFSVIENHFSQINPCLKLIYLQGQAIGGDMFLGYNEALCETLLSISSSQSTSVPDEKSLNIFGYPFTRFEGDIDGDFEEIKNILKNLGIKINIFLPGKSDYTDLESIYKTDKSLIFNSNTDGVSKILEEKFNQKTFEINLPLGISNTINFYESVGKIYGVDTDLMIKDKLSEIVPKIQIMQSILIGKRFGLIGDSQKVLGLLDLLLDIGMLPAYITLTDVNQETNGKIADIIKLYGYEGDVEIFSEKDRNFINLLINENKYNVDLLIGSGTEKYMLKSDIPFLELFFPMITRHFLCKSSILGFDGVISILNDIYNLLDKPEYHNVSNSLGNMMGEFTFYSKINK